MGGVTTVAISKRRIEIAWPFSRGRSRASFDGHGRTDLPFFARTRSLKKNLSQSDQNNQRRGQTLIPHNTLQQPQTTMDTTNESQISKPSEPVLCKAGCGFFVSIIIIEESFIHEGGRYVFRPCLAGKPENKPPPRLHRRPPHSLPHCYGRPLSKQGITWRPRRTPRRRDTALGHFRKHSVRVTSGGPNPPGRPTERMIPYGRCQNTPCPPSQCLTHIFLSPSQGSGATGGLCSKCWRDNMKKEEAAVCPPAQTTETETTPAPTAAAVESTTPMDVDTNATTTTIKKKKKKKSYKSLMAGMMKTEQPRDVEKEKEQLRSVTGGGAFSKIDKI